MALALGLTISRGFLAQESNFLLRFNFPWCLTKYCRNQDSENRSSSDFTMEEDEDEEEEATNLLRDRFRLSAVTVAEAAAKRNDMDISEPISGCIADLAFKYAEQVAKDLQLFAWHGRRKSVKMEDVILSTHRNDNLAAALRPLYDDLKANDPKSDRRRRRKIPTNDEKPTSSMDILEQDPPDE